MQKNNWFFLHKKHADLSIYRAIFNTGDIGSILFQHKIFSEKNVVFQCSVCRNRNCQSIANVFMVNKQLHQNIRKQFILSKNVYKLVTKHATLSPSPKKLLCATTITSLPQARVTFLTSIFQPLPPPSSPTLPSPPITSLPLYLYYQNYHCLLFFVILLVLI